MDLNVRPVPIPDPISAFYWESAKRGRLSVQGFEGLDVLEHPPSPVPEILGGGPPLDQTVPIAVEVSGRGCRGRPGGQCSRTALRIHGVDQMSCPKEIRSEERL